MSIYGKGHYIVHNFYGMQIAPSLSWVCVGFFKSASTSLQMFPLSARPQAGTCVGHKGAGPESAEGGLEPGWCVEVPGGSGVPRGHRKWGHGQGGEEEASAGSSQALQGDEAAGWLAGAEDTFI